MIVNWSSRSLLRECLAALDRSTIADRLDVIVVDNASTDGSADGLAMARTRLEVVLNPENRGFAAACNQGAKLGGAPACCSSIPTSGCGPIRWRPRCDYLDDPAHARVGVVGAQLIDADGHVQRSCARTPTLSSLLLQTLFLDRLCPALVPPHFLTEWDHGDTRPVDQVMGAFLMIRRRCSKSSEGSTSDFSSTTKTSTCAWRRGRRDGTSCIMRARRRSMPAAAPPRR